MATQYVIVKEPFAHFYSDTTTERAEPIMGVKPRDTNNVAYTLYNKPYGKYQFLGGCNFLFPTSIPFIPGMVVDFYADNTTTGITANSFINQLTLPSNFNNTDVRIFMGIPAMDKLDNGLIECYGSVTDTKNITVYVMPSLFFTIQKP
ncbi:hypothetical protein CFN16_25675 [Pseudomonas fluorescens]|uniref:Uncharacterized protein n=1 Tax=Pseudomonas fluorescens TaxID=294 RepID=A0A345V3U3_PSEFL|nr:hypothetical protein [Pseudomonas fluorescens]AXJ07395.1 hypothetical protein CFN16_25675 [Pseudomonas fluorescens]WJK09493.1 hypothetical protein QR290_27380 [Pseudomonas fluorescens]